MADETRQPNDEAPNAASSMEKAEGSRESLPDEDTHQQGAGITNRSREQEQEEQQSLPPRGTSKDRSHA